MTYKSKILELANKVNFISLQQYLISRGWNKRNTAKDDVAVLTSPEDNPIFDILLPLSRSFTDYSQAILEALKKISKYENREETKILNDLITPPADIVRYSIENENTISGLIPFNEGFDLLQSARKSLLAAASDIVSPALFHRRMSYKPAIQFIESCYMGQTERGSYIASIVCPFIKISDDEKAIQLSLFSPEEAIQTSITRQVTKKLMSSIQSTKRIIESGNLDSLINQREDSIISANFLESLVEINEFTHNSKIVISTSWTSTIPIPQNVPSTIEITNDYIEPIKSVIDTIKPEIIESTGEYVGKISQIKANPDLKNREDGEITFIFISDDERALSAKVTLKDNDFRKAIEAFEQGKNIKVSGTLKMHTRQRVIETPTFKVID